MKLSTILPLALAAVGIVSSTPISSDVPISDSAASTSLVERKYDPFTDAPADLKCRMHIHWLNKCPDGLNGKGWQQNYVTIYGAVNEKGEHILPDGATQPIGYTSHVKVGPWAIQGYHHEMLVNAHDDKGELHLSFNFGHPEVVCSTDTTLLPTKDVIIGPPGCMWQKFTGWETRHGDLSGGLTLKCAGNFDHSNMEKQGEIYLAWKCDLD